ncbi:MAG: oligosaccharide flippase family protein, partial [Pseudomonadota bacterium]
MIQLVTYATPLITLPYVTRVLGPEGWGLVAWTQIIIGYFGVMQLWGFQISATSSIAKCRSSSEVARVFWLHWMGQLCLSFVALAVLAAALGSGLISDSYRAHFTVGALGVAVVLFTPQWLFMGLEKTVILSATQALMRVATIPFIFLLVKSPSDGPKLLAIVYLLPLFGGILLLFWTYRNYPPASGFLSFRRALSNLNKT